ncbi:MAG: hypothetical protein IPF93_15000 [Saprospiraceae bacterium]|nr:hypothetical protein [Saprospiraceae bacterium]
MEFWCHDTKYHGKAAGSYSVTTSGICPGTSSATAVAILPATNPTITASGPLTFCQGDSIRLTSSTTSASYGVQEKPLKVSQ